MRTSLDLTSLVTRIWSPLPVVAGVAALALSASCAASAPEGGDLPHEDEGSTGSVSAALGAGDPVSRAVSESCTTASVRGLGEQLVDELECIRPNTLSSIAGIPNTRLGSAVFPYMQAPAARSLRGVAAARGAPLVINSAFRTLPQQYLLYRWYRTGRCGIRLAASPGRSNHEGALALDVEDSAGWRGSFQARGFRWLGSSDPVHFDYVGSGAVSLRGLSVLAFQRLWNRNYPNDKIAADGDYGPETEARLARSPIGGFRLGATCKNPGFAPEEPVGDVAELPVEADGPEGPGDDATPSAPSIPLEFQNQGSGCNASSSGRAPGFAGLAIVGALGLLAARRRR